MDRYPVAISDHDSPKTEQFEQNAIVSGEMQEMMKENPLKSKWRHTDFTACVLKVGSIICVKAQVHGFYYSGWPLDVTAGVCHRGHPICQWNQEDALKGLICVRVNPTHHKEKRTYARIHLFIVQVLLHGSESYSKLSPGEQRLLIKSRADVVNDFYE